MRLPSLFGVKRLARNAALDLRYGAFLGGTVKSPYGVLGIHDTASTDYEALPEIFENAVDSSDVLVDIGCGKGRVINWWLSRGYTNEMFGIEIDPNVARDAAHRLRKWPNVHIICGDAIDSLPEKGTVFYLFNPFNEKWVNSFKSRAGDLVTRNRKVRIFYYNCIHCHVFDDSQWIVQRISLRSPFHSLAIIQPAVDADPQGASQ